MRVFSRAFHTSYQYSLATAFPEVDWHFVLGIWHENRPIPHNVFHDTIYRLSEFDAFLAHTPEQLIELREILSQEGVNPHKIIYVNHWPFPDGMWDHFYNGSKKEFVKFASDHAIVSVSHHILHDFGFYSHIINEAIPHYVPHELYKDCVWNPQHDDFINVVFDFFAPNRGTGADFWMQLDGVNKRLFGGANGALGAGELPTMSDFAREATAAKGYLWVADKAAMSFAPLEAMSCGCPVIAPDNADWSKMFVNGQDVLLYEPGNRDSVLATIEHFNSSPELQHRLSVNGREAVKRNYGMKTFRARWRRVLDAVTTAW